MKEIDGGEDETVVIDRKTESAGHVGKVVE